MRVQIAGPGCPKCVATEKNVREACAKLGLEAEIEHLYDVKEYAKLGVMLTPAVVVDGKVVVSGHVPRVEELTQQLGPGG